MKAVIYTRVSTDEQAKNNLSLKGQKDASEKHCSDLNIEIAGRFSDEGESAKTANRPQLIAALEFCRIHYKEVDYFVVWKIDRFARQSADHHYIKSVLKKYGIQLMSVTEPIDDTPAGRLMESMLAGYAQFDNDVRAERSLGGVRRRTEEGGWPHLAPLGYDNYKDELRRPTLKPTDVTGGRITKWLLMFLKGTHSQHDMYNLAWKMGIKSRSGKHISYQQICNMLRNPVYGGMIWSKLVDTPVKGLHKGLITYEEHLTILDILDGKRKLQPLVRGEGSWPMRGGFVKCSDCQKPLTGSAPKGRTKTYPLYHCSYCRARTVGHRVSIKKSELDGQFESLLEKVTPSEDHMKLFRAIFIKKLQEATVTERSHEARLQSDLVALRERKNRIIEMFIDGELSANEKKEQGGKVEAQILRTSLELGDTTKQAVDYETLIDFGINMIQNMPKLWRISSPREQQLLQRAVFPDGLTYSFVNGFGIAKTSNLYLLASSFEDFSSEKSSMVATSGLEPPTPGL